LLANKLHLSLDANRCCEAQQRLYLTRQYQLKLANMMNILTDTSKPNYRRGLPVCN
jgi:hypothetical protein